MITNRQQIIDDSPPHRELFKEFIEAIDFRSEQTRKAYKGTIGRYIKYHEDKNVLKPKESDLMKFKRYLREKGNHGATIQLYVVSIRRFYKWLDRMGYYPDISIDLRTEKIDPTFKRQPLTVDEAKKLLDYAKEHSSGDIVKLRNYTIIYLLLHLGLRTIEVARANFEDVRKEGDNHYLYVQGKGHTDKDDSIRLTPSALEVIDAYKKARKSEKGAMFTNHGHHKSSDRITSKMVSQIVKKTLREINIDCREITAHSLRHTCATLALANGATLEEVMQLLRHKNIQTTMIYLHVTNRENNRSQDLVDKALTKAKKEEQNNE